MNIMELIKRAVVGAPVPQAPLPTAAGTDGAPMTPIPTEVMAGGAPPMEAPKKRRGGLLNILEDLIAPEPGSFVHSMYNNKIWNAKEGQRQYKLEEAKRQLELQQMQRDAALGKTQITPRGDAIRVRPSDGTVEELYRPAPQPGEQERILDQWRKATDPTEKALLAQMLRGYQYGGDYLARKTDEMMRLERDKTEGRKELKRIPNRSISTRNGSSTDSAAIPPGFVPDY